MQKTNCGFIVSLYFHPPLSIHFFYSPPPDPQSSRNPSPHIPPHATGRTVVFARVAPPCTGLHLGSAFQRHPCAAPFTNPGHLTPTSPVMCTRTPITHTVTHRHGEIRWCVCLPFRAIEYYEREISFSSLSIIQSGPDHPSLFLHFSGAESGAHRVQKCRHPPAGRDSCSTDSFFHPFPAVCSG
jgi:hypothetical protein